MKLRSHSLALSTALLLCSVTFMGGCATTGLDRSVNTKDSILEVDSELKKMSTQIDVTGASLDKLVMASKSDLKKNFDSYTDNVKKLEHEGTKTLKRVDEMKADSKEYFSEWEKQGDNFTNSEIRALSEERRSRLSNIYARVPAAGIGIKGAYTAYLTDLKEIQMFLSNDLTPRGIEVITPVAEKTTRDGEILKASLRPLSDALDEIKVELYSGKK